MCMLVCTEGLHFSAFITVHGGIYLAKCRNKHRSLILPRALISKSILHALSQLGAFLQPPMKGVVLQTFGAGNVPAEQPLLEKLKEACDRGVVIVNCTQCASGIVTNNYPAARVSEGAGM